MSQVLGSNAAHAFRGIRLAPLVSPAHERCEKLRIKLDPRVGQTIMRRGWLVMSQKFRLEPPRNQTLIKLLSRDSEPRRQSDIRIQSRQRGIVQRLCRWMKAVQTVRPASNDNDLIKPRRQRFD